MTRHVELLSSELLARHFPGVRGRRARIADPAVRNRGTIGGSLCQADPSEDLSAVCAALKAAVMVRGPRGERLIGMHEFHVGPYMTAVAADEILTEVRLRVRPGAGKRPREGSSDERAISPSWPRPRRCGSMAGPTSTPAWDSARRADDDRRGRSSRASPGQGAIRGALPGSGEAGRRAAMPLADTRGPVDYKRHLAEVLTKRALHRATARALQQEA